MNALTSLSLLALLGLAASTGHAQEAPEPAPPEATSSCLTRGEAIKGSLEKLLPDPEYRQLAGLQRALEPSAAIATACTSSTTRPCARPSTR